MVKVEDHNAQIRSRVARALHFRFHSGFKLSSVGKPGQGIKAFLRERALEKRPPVRVAVFGGEVKGYRHPVFKPVFLGQLFPVFR